MERFRYKARSADGKRVSGQVEARDIKQAASVLRERSLVVVKLSPAARKFQLTFLSSIFHRVKFVDIVNFTRQLATMINAGLGLTETLSLLEDQSSPAMKTMVAEVLRDVEGGKSLGDALEKHPKAFNTVYVSLVRAGEAAGKLDEMLNRLADNLEKERDFRSKTKGALVYPVVVVIGMVLVTAVMMIFVVPKISELFEDFGTELPFATKLLIAVSNFMSNYWYIGLFGIVAFVWLFRIWRATPIGRQMWDSLLFKIPIYGKLRKELLLTEFCRTLGLLVGAGVSIVEGLNIVAEVMGNVIYADSVREAAKRVEKGISVAATIANYDSFPSILSQMLAVGEETGKVDEVLLKLAVYFETEAEQLVKGLTTAIEPLIMIVLGVGVGFLVISIIMPIYNLTSQL